VFSDTRVRVPALDVTMVPKEPQPRVEGVSLSGAMARHGGQPKSRSRRRPASHTGVSSTTQRRVARNAILCVSKH
jgi:hypothetical protein